ncbi:ArsR/SmtB family transcription factor [Leptotrichia buccalis]|jgi:transcriptional regulator, arsR family|uniref:Transcriptional regulator, ArsR family n=1 Tax=Leptotrichia buccalis (strain ATCC 14201 / DSM 1135 / JCM 12969 / NCTC 10249 / C-1013-b) TaxID=523794 RepID=C7NDS2_LEPBD|nr:metalloregulator ArsR/SmtB family transcription factor [Leptotrichia buccalis]ACV40036.1 transcriptional regulator, ArsR family [Leptotrichia buccalis C-1013-b]
MAIKEEENTTYETKAIHKDVVKRVEKTMPKEEIIYDLADFFKILGDTTRMRILSALFQEEMCVYDIANLLKMTQSAISHQLRVLKQGRFVKHRKEGKIVYYSLEDEHIKHIVEQGMIHILEKR